jgi:hypothetical protein
MVTFKEFLEFSVPSLTWRSDNTSTSKTTASSTCREDDLQLTTWTDFLTSAQKTFADVTDFELKEPSIEIFNKLIAPDLVVNCEDRVLDLFRDLIAKPLCNVLSSKELAHEGA